MTDLVGTRAGPSAIDQVDLTPYLHPSPLVVVISGPSGAGKDATIQHMREMGQPFHFVVTATTRSPRCGEAHGVDYIFVSRPEFECLIAQGELLEYAVVYGDYKGIPKAQVRQALASGQDVVMRVDVQGAARLRQLMPEAVFVFLTVASEAELLGRLRGRRTETDDELRCRLEMARAEMREIPNFDYVVVNSDGALDRTVAQILAIMQAEKLRAKPRRVSL